IEMAPHEYTWKPDVFAATTLAVTGLLYAVGWWRMSRRRAAPPQLESTAFVIGWLTLALALLSPIATMSEWLFSVHMTQHELLMLVAAALLAIGRPLVPMLFALPERTRIAMSTGASGMALRLASSPLPVFLLH